MARLDPQRDQLKCDLANRWILASGSPRRIEMLRAAGQNFDVRPSCVPEVRGCDESPEVYACRVARAKADDVALQSPGRWVLAADTIVVVDTDVFGKPRDRVDARRMLLRLSGRAHEVLTAFVLLDLTGRVFAESVVRSQVAFRPLSLGEIDEYVKSGEPLDKAGAYAIQGAAGQFISSVSGSRSNVVGLPLDEVRVCLQAAKLWREAGPARGAET